MKMLKTPLILELQHSKYRDLPATCLPTPIAHTYSSHIHITPTPVQRMWMTEELAMS